MRNFGSSTNRHVIFPSVADHPLGPATHHRLGKLLPHQLANQTRAPPRADSSFCSSAYEVLAAVSSCCSPPKGRFLRITHPSHLQCMPNIAKSTRISNFDLFNSWIFNLILLPCVLSMTFE
ncbi:hypothetical protein Csa_012779 [Cucumis sativus]|nr:hypothetical protein Csa_012779 [Cucumis sativus]